MLHIFRFQEGFQSIVANLIEFQESGGHPFDLLGLNNRNQIFIFHFFFSKIQFTFIGTQTLVDQVVYIFFCFCGHALNSLRIKLVLKG